MRGALVELRALTEAQLDFPEEELDPLHREDAARRLARVRGALEQVLARSRQGSLLRSGVHAVLAGRPNVGKSSLLNRLAGEERAIVTATPGTTRDALREPVHIDGVAVVLVDTAGLRASVDEVERLGMARVSANLLPMLGVRPRLGRYFGEEEDRPGNDRVVIVTDRLWQRRFHGDPAILNESIMLNGNPHVVAGVLAPWFRFPRPDQLASFDRSAMSVDIFKPIALNRTNLPAVGFNYGAIGRLRADVTGKQAYAELNAVQAALTKELPMAGMELRAEVTALQEQIAGGSRRGLLVLLAAIGAVLLIMCVNLGNLMLARATARWRETAVRVALGASPWRIVRQVLTESIVISLSGGVAGLALAYVAVRALVAAAPVDLPRLDEVRIDYRALLFACAASLLGVLGRANPPLARSIGESAGGFMAGHLLGHLELVLGDEIGAAGVPVADIGGEEF